MNTIVINRENDVKRLIDAIGYNEFFSQVESYFTENSKISDFPHIDTLIACLLVADFSSEEYIEEIFELSKRALSELSQINDKLFEIEISFKSKNYEGVYAS